jgi:hypothetical protein
MVLTAYSALFPVTGLFCHRHQRDAQVIVANLNASVGASEPHGFAVRVGASRLAHRRVHRIPHPTFVTIAIRPSWGRGAAGVIVVILARGEAKKFLREGWTGTKSADPASAVYWHLLALRSYVTRSQKRSNCIPAASRMAARMNLVAACPSHLSPIAVPKTAPHRTARAYRPK